MSCRLKTKYENLSNKFLLKSFDYEKQFCHLYTHRLNEMTSILLPLVKKRWGDHPVRKICNLREEENKSCVVIGAIYKHQANKPSILRDISEQNQLAPQPARQHYADPEDKLILEDELQRLCLKGNVDIRSLATGVVCAVLGTVEEDEHFVVEDLLFCGSGPQRTLDIKVNTTPKFIALISGLDQMHTEINCVDELNLLQFWLGGAFNKQNISGELVRLIIAGNSTDCKIIKQAKGAKVAPAEVVSAISSLDNWFAAWAASIAVDLMPGAFDPANYMIPQQPFHRCMFPQASRSSTFQSVSNPYHCLIDEVSILGTSGQNIDDILRTSVLDKPLDALRSTLIWGHIAPTTPDTLACYPYVDSDPFMMRECPHIYFAGNCCEYATELHTGTDGQKTRLICLPSFSKSKSIVVVNLQTLECKQICFST